VPLSHNTAYYSTAVSRLLVQYRDKPRMLSLLKSYAQEIQALEDALWGLCIARMIQNAPTGDLLDKLGRIVGQLRYELDDATYLLYIKARIRANRSFGNPACLYAVMAALFGASTSMEIDQSPKASLALRIWTVRTALEGMTATSFLGASKAAGVRAILEWQQQDDSLTYTFAQATFCKKASLVNDTTMIIDPRTTAQFPATGSVVIDGGLSTAETVAYTSIVGNVMTFSTPLTQAHAIGAEVELVGDAGLGWGDNLNPLVGGEYATAQQAI
jgi:hypothetical protein